MAPHEHRQPSTFHASEPGPLRRRFSDDTADHFSDPPILQIKLLKPNGESHEATHRSARSRADGQSLSALILIIAQAAQGPSQAEVPPQPSLAQRVAPSERHFEGKVKILPPIRPQIFHWASIVRVKFYEQRPAAIETTQTSQVPKSRSQNEFRAQTALGGIANSRRLPLVRPAITLPADPDKPGHAANGFHSVPHARGSMKIRISSESCRQRPHGPMESRSCRSIPWAQMTEPPSRRVRGRSCPG